MQSSFAQRTPGVPQAGLFFLGPSYTVEGFLIDNQLSIDLVVVKVQKILFILFFILHVCHYKSTNTIYNYTAMMSHKDYINISHKYYDGWNDHTEIKSPITGFNKNTKKIKEYTLIVITSKIW